MLSDFFSCICIHYGLWVWGQRSLPIVLAIFRVSQKLSRFSGFFEKILAYEYFEFFFSVFELTSSGWQTRTYLLNLLNPFGLSELPETT